MRVVHEGVAKLYDADVLFLMLPSMLASVATRLLAHLAHLAPLSKWLMREVTSLDLSV